MGRGSGRDEQRQFLVVSAILLVGIAVMIPLLAKRLSAHNPSPQEVAAAAAEPPAAPSIPTKPSITLPAPGSSVLFFGDSYTEGYAATPLTDGYAYLTAQAFGWFPTVDSGSGSGYLEAGPLGKTYIQRMDDLPDIDPKLIILQGGLNDQNAKPTLTREKSAADAVVRALKVKYPTAQIVMFGPVPIVKRSPRELLTVDTSLRVVAADNSLPYIDPLVERWDIQSFLISDHTHPDSAGHSYIAARLQADIKRLAGQQ